MDRMPLNEFLKNMHLISVSVILIKSIMGFCECVILHYNFILAEIKFSIYIILYVNNLLKVFGRFFFLSILPGKSERVKGNYEKDY